MKKQIISLIILALLPLVANADVVEIDGIYYNVIPKGKVAEVTRNPNKYSGSVVIPETVEYNGVQCSVTSIGQYAFNECSSLTSVTIPNSVTSIGYHAFYRCLGLKEVHISNIAAWYKIEFDKNDSNPLEYAHHLYLNGEEIKDLIIPDSVTEIKNSAFSGCSGLTSVTIGNSVTSIGESAFKYCSGLMSVIIPNSVSSIGIAAFNGSGLTSVTIPNSVTSIGDYAFGSCSSLKEVNYNATNCTYMGSYYNPVFFDNPSSINVINIADNVQIIPANAFYGCGGLTSVTIGKSVNSIGGGAFSNCSSLKEVHISDIAAWCKIEFDQGYSNPLIYAHHLYLNGEEIKDLIIPNSVTEIKKSAFSGCSGLTSVTIPNSVSNIGGSAFDGCSGLTSVTIGNSVTSIGSSAFNGCSGLTSVIIPNSVTSIGSSAFNGCSGLTSVTIPNSVTSIGSSVFSGCSGLTNVNIHSNVTSIGSHAFYGCNGLTSINIPNSVTSIGSSTFQNCTRLTSITIPNSVTSIGEYAFSGCSGLTNITIGSGVKTVKGSAFSECPELTDVFCYAEKVPSTESNVFSGSLINYATLHVPAASVNNYKATVPWKNFMAVVAIDGTTPTPPDDPTPPETPKCATPTISYKDGELSFSCATEGVEYVSEVTVADAKKYYTDKVNLGTTYIVSVIAMKTGYDNSDAATMEINVGGPGAGPVGDLNKDGKVDAADLTRLIEILLE